MPYLYIRTCNSDFHSIDDGDDFERAEDALASGVKGALSIARDEIHEGAAAAAVEVSVEGQDGITVLRSVVAVSISPLSTARPSAASQD